MLGTGGTIAGEGSDLQYRAGQVDAGRLVGDALADRAAKVEVEVEVEQIAQIDSKNLTFDVWRRLVDATARHLARSEVQGVVITHGTDTLEETAYLLQRLLAPAKPVVLTGAMRPSTSPRSDGPQNLRDALRVAREPGACGVTVVFDGRIIGALDVRKVHPTRLGAFAAGEAGALGIVEAGRVRRFREWPVGDAAAPFPSDPAAWPVVEIVTSHAGARAATVEALVASGVHGIVVAATGNGTVHSALEAALGRAWAGGVAVLRATRCLDGAILEHESTMPRFDSAGALTPVQARIELMLTLNARSAP